MVATAISSDRSAISDTLHAVSAALAEHFKTSQQWSLKERASLAEKIHKQFSWDSIGSRYLRLYEEVVKDRNS